MAAAEAAAIWFWVAVHYPRSAELRFGKVSRKSPVRADSEIGAPLSAMLHEASVKMRVGGHARIAA